MYKISAEVQCIYVCSIGGKPRTMLLYGAAVQILQPAKDLLKEHQSTVGEI